MAPTPTPIGAEIRRIRQAMGMTLEEFGKHVSLPWQTVAQYEYGRAVPAADRLLRIIHAARRLPDPFHVARVAAAVARAA